ncbi:MAG: phage baseplate assembly protein V [Verrucomicrobium sp.]|nr:phage baseplate assembly protein V [Verrucomicrobium sp.]
MSAAKISDNDRRLACMIRPGLVSQVDYVNALVRVKLGDAESAWLPWLVTRAAGDRTWSALEVGEQVLVLSPSGDTRMGYVLGSIYRASFPAPASSADVSTTVYGDGASVSYDRAAHAYSIDVPGGGTVKATAGDAYAEVASEKVTLAVGSSKIEVSSSGIVLTCGGTALNLSSGGATLAAASASGFENH